MVQARETAGVLGGLVGGLALMVVLLMAMTGGGFFMALLVLMLLPVSLGVLAFERGVGPIALAHPRPAIAGALSAAGLFAFYFNIMSFLEGVPHTYGHLGSDWTAIGAVALGFGVLVGYTVDARHHPSFRILGAGLAGTILGMAALLACCAPLLIHVVPWSGVLQVAVFMMQYGAAIAGFGVAVNLAASFELAREPNAARS